MTRVPVTVLTGFLGAGKTSLLNRLLRGEPGRRHAVIVNEFGELGIDGDLIVGAEEEVYELNNGCVCCKLRGDLVRVIGGLLRRPGRFDGIFIETTGLADPAPIVQTFQFDDFLRQHAQLDSVICVADARHLVGQLASEPEATAQLAQADLVLLNKADLVDAPTLLAAQRAVAELNPTAECLQSIRGDVELERLLDRGAFDIARLQLPGPWIDAAPSAPPARPQVVARHSEDVASVSLRFAAPLDRSRFTPWLQRLIAERGAGLLRAKGIVAFAGESRRFVFQAVHMTVDDGLDRPWRDGESRESRLVFIGRGLDAEELRSELLYCLSDAVEVPA